MAVLDDFKNSGRHFFKMGIRYGWGEEEAPSLGTLWVVKNRLPEAFANQMAWSQAGSSWHSKSIQNHIK